MGKQKKCKKVLKKLKKHNLKEGKLNIEITKNLTHKYIISHQVMNIFQNIILSYDESNQNREDVIQMLR